MHVRGQQHSEGRQEFGHQHTCWILSISLLLRRIADACTHARQLKQPAFECGTVHASALHTRVSAKNTVHVHHSLIHRPLPGCVPQRDKVIVENQWERNVNQGGGAMKQAMIVDGEIAYMLE